MRRTPVVDDSEQRNRRRPAACLERAAAGATRSRCPRGRGRCRSAELGAAVVRDLELQLLLAPAQRHPRLGRAGVLEGVRQRFLHEPVGRQIDAGRQLALVALDLELDVEARLAHRSDQDVDRPQRWLRREDSGIVPCSRRRPTSRRISVSASRPVASTVSSACRSRSCSGAGPTHRARLHRHHGTECAITSWARGRSAVAPRRLRSAERSPGRPPACGPLSASRTCPSRAVTRRSPPKRREQETQEGDRGGRQLVGLRIDDDDRGVEEQQPGRRAAVEPSRRATR